MIEKFSAIFLFFVLTNRLNRVIMSTTNKERGAQYDKYTLQE